MSVGKLGWFTALAMMVALLSLGRSGVQKAAYARPTAKSPSRLVKALPAHDGIPAAIFLPVQTKDAKNLGLGKLLVASRDLGDPNFVQSVVLLVHYDDESVVGLILNRRTRIPLSRVLEQLPAAKDRTDPVYLGGPVDTPSVFALFQSPAKVEGAEHVFGAVYLIDTAPLFEQTISARPAPGVFHAYLGYAGWTNAQLRMEVELGAWYIFPGDAKTVFDSDPDTLWSRMIHKTELELAEREPQPFSSGGKHLPRLPLRPPT